MPASLPSSSEILIVGAGPHGLATALHLIAARPSMRDSITVVDPSGGWLATWHAQLARLDCETLRSAGVHHPSPAPDDLGTYHQINGVAATGLPYGVPSRAAFGGFCADVVKRAGLGDHVVAARVRQITPRHGRVAVQTDVGGCEAARVVIASNPHARNVPAWVWRLLPLEPGRLEHADDVDLGAEGELGGQRVGIVGAGLTAAHLACGAVARGAQVVLVPRRPLQTRDFDVEPGWLGPKYLRAFSNEPDPRERLRAALLAREGGTVPPWMKQRLDRCRAEGGLTIAAPGPVHSATRAGTGLTLHTEAGDHEVDRCWLATGTRPTMHACRPVAELVPDLPLVDCYPVPDPALAIGPWPIHITGRLATIELGPAAGNLWGARHAARRITEAHCHR